jgi:hypothetical protein
MSFTFRFLPRSYLIFSFSSFFHLRQTAISRPITHSISPIYSRLYSSSSSSSSSSLPLLSFVLRRFFFLVHPDLYSDSPNHQAVNAKSVQALNSFLTELKATSDSDSPYPPPQFINLSFFIRKRRGDRIFGVSPVGMEKENEKKKKNGKTKSKINNKAGDVIPGEYHLIHHTIALTGGECKGVIERSLAELFKKVDLPSEFAWDNEYWKLKPPLDLTKLREQQEEEE